MIGIDSKSSLKHIAITSMRICTEPNFKLEIRIGLGGTKDVLTLCTPSYAVAGVDLLNRLIQLQEKFKQSQTIPGNIPTKILNNSPVLTFFSAWTAAVRVNNLDANIGRENAQKMLSYIKKYIDNYHSNLSRHIRYEMDHGDTYEDTLLNYIIAHYVHNYTDEQTKQQLTAQTIRRGSNEDGSIRYTSMHLIIFKDIIDKKSLHPLFHLLDENENNEPTCLYDCIITIGGSVEKRFNKVRYLVRQTFMNDSQLNKEQYHFPLSIRMLSRAGQTPVYYHDKNEITVHQISNKEITNVHLTDKKYRDIKEGLSILLEDIGVSVLKPIWNHIYNLGSHDISSWKNIVLTLIELCLEIWRNHAKDIKTCQCLTENKTAIEQICEHYQLSNDAECLILTCILKELEIKNHIHFGERNTTNRRRNNSICTNRETTDTIIHKLDDVLSQILIEFIQNQIL
ncbi:unnamed protein product [Adineta steineri]|uniref:Uncharacterized protein n=1 Tax=Adineta steineri TaxID=433720 RepID=A0A814M3V5_9BILA|nr:unnamed protein product [Adineta steineri]CAF1164198.1 unnamed protein product [Adineta steineri]